MNCWPSRTIRPHAGVGGYIHDWLTLNHWITGPAWFLLILFIPQVFNFIISFTAWKGLGAPRWVGTAQLPATLIVTVSVLVLVGAAPVVGLTRPMSIARYSPLSSWPVTGLTFSSSV